MAWNYLSIPKLQRLHLWSLGKDKWFHPTHYIGCNYLSMLGFKLNHVRKRGPWPSEETVLKNHGFLTFILSLFMGWIHEAKLTKTIAPRRPLAILVENMWCSKFSSNISLKQLAIISINIVYAIFLSFVSIKTSFITCVLVNMKKQKGLNTS